MMKKRLLLYVTIGIALMLGAGGALFFSGCTGGSSAYVLSGTLYIGGYSTEKIYVVDLGNTASIASIDLPAGAQPDWLTLSPDKTKLYCSSESNTKVYIINTVTNEYEKEVANICTGPRGIAFTPDGTIAAVVCAGGQDIALIDTATGTYNNNSEDTIPYWGDYDEKYGIAIHPTLNKCYVASGPTIAYGDVAGGATMAATYSITGSGIYDIAVSSNGSRVYSSALITDPALGETVVTLSVDGSGSLSEIDTAECVSNNLKKLRLSPDQNKVYVPMMSLSAIDYMNTSNTSTMTSIDLTPYGQAGAQDVVFSADSKKAFAVIDSTTDSILVIDTATGTVDQQIILPACDPKSIAFKQ
jgi:YVTN family beta-propeller protein